jgi:hypothetical protein
VLFVHESNELKKSCVILKKIKEIFGEIEKLFTTLHHQKNENAPQPKTY